MMLSRRTKSTALVNGSTGTGGNMTGRGTGKDRSTNVSSSVSLKTLISRPSCQFCKKTADFDKRPKETPGKTYYTHMMQHALFEKYASSQNYYYTRDINDILGNNRTPAVFVFKDWGCYDEQEEYLKRFYKGSEYGKKIDMLAEYYKFHRDISRIFILPETDVLNRFHDKKRRIEYVRIKKMLDEEEEAKKPAPKKGSTPAPLVQKPMSKYDIEDPVLAHLDDGPSYHFTSKPENPKKPTAVTSREKGAMKKPPGEPPASRGLASSRQAKKLLEISMHGKDHSMSRTLKDLEHHLVNAFEARGAAAAGNMDDNTMGVTNHSATNFSIYLKNALQGSSDNEPVNAIGVDMKKKVTPFGAVAGTDRLFSSDKMGKPMLVQPPLMEKNGIVGASQRSQGSTGNGSGFAQKASKTGTNFFPAKRNNEINDDLAQMKRNINDLLDFKPGNMNAGIAPPRQNTFMAKKELQGSQRQQQQISGNAAQGSRVTIDVEESNQSKGASSPRVTTAMSARWKSGEGKGGFGDGLYPVTTRAAAVGGGYPLMSQRGTPQATTAAAFDAFARKTQGHGRFQSIPEANLIEIRQLIATQRGGGSGLSDKPLESVARGNVQGKKQLVAAKKSIGNAAEAGHVMVLNQNNIVNIYVDDQKNLEIGNFIRSPAIGKIIVSTGAANGNGGPGIGNGPPSSTHMNGTSSHRGEGQANLYSSVGPKGQPIPANLATQIASFKRTQSQAFIVADTKKLVATVASPTKLMGQKNAGPVSGFQTPTGSGAGALGFSGSQPLHLKTKSTVAVPTHMRQGSSKKLG